MKTYVDESQIDAYYADMVGKTVVITGAARGMGRIFAEELVARGVNVVLTDLDDSALSTAQAINDQTTEATEQNQQRGRAVGVVADVTDRQAHDTVLETAVQEFGQLDGWVNNAGVFPESPILDCPESQIDLSLDVNVKGTLYGAQAAASHFKDNGGGAIVNMASVSALRIRRNRGAYNTAKAAALQLTYSLAVELGDHGVRVNAVAPGFIDTAMTQWVHDTPGALDNALQNVPLHRIGSPVEVFAAVYFLLSGSSRYITGTFISVDGGSRHV